MPAARDQSTMKTTIVPTSKVGDTPIEPGRTAAFNVANPYSFLQSPVRNAFELD